MNRTIGTQIGGWAALAVAIGLPLEIAALLLGTGSIADRFASDLYATAESIRAAAFLVMVNGLHPILRGLHGDLAILARLIGSVAALGIISVDALALLGADLTSLELTIFVMVNALIALWYLLAGLVLARGDRGLRTLGWTGQLGGLGAALTTVLIAIGFQSTGVGVQSWYIYAAVLSLFALAFLVRLWQYAALGKLPDTRFL